jgi:hypothetical protein
MSRHGRVISWSVAICLIGVAGIGVIQLCGLLGASTSTPGTHLPVASKEVGGETPLTRHGMSLRGAEIERRETNIIGSHPPATMVKTCRAVHPGSPSFDCKIAFAMVSGQLAPGRYSDAELRQAINGPA